MGGSIQRQYDHYMKEKAKAKLNILKGANKFQAGMAAVGLLNSLGVSAEQGDLVSPLGETREIGDGEGEGSGTNSPAADGRGLFGLGGGGRSASRNNSVDHGGDHHGFVHKRGRAVIGGEALLHASRKNTAVGVEDAANNLDQFL
jgi:hypothetical protein